MKTRIISLFTIFFSFAYGQDSCSFNILVTLGDIPKFVLYENGRIIFKTDHKSLTYLKDSLSKEAKDRFINDLRLDTSYYSSRISFPNMLCDDCGKELVFYTKVNGRRQTHIIFDYEIDDPRLRDTIPKVLQSLYDRAFNYRSTTKTEYNSDKVIIWLMPADKQALKKKYKKSSWTFNWIDYEKSNINSYPQFSPMLLVDTKHYQEILQKMSTEYIIFHNRPYYVFTARQYLEKEQCFGEKRYYLSNK